MKYYWSKEKCGDPAIVITNHDLWHIIMSVCDEYFFGGKDSVFKVTLDEIVQHLNKQKDDVAFRQYCFALLASKICADAAEKELTAPFAGRDFTEVFLRENNEETMKTFYIQNNVGKVKYVVSYHDGVKKNRDGSDFYDIATFKNKKKMEAFIRDLENDGYKKRGIKL